ncbi:MAG TPA: hypothetical protein DDX04_06350, partial [Massilia sp.]|nr:hypothetical protein [Massilia sp.]
MSDAVTRSRIGSMTYLAPSMALVAADAVDAVDNAIGECIAQHQVSIVLDLGKVPLLSGRALEMMTRAANRLGSLGGWLKLAYPSPLLLDILNVTGVSEKVALYDAPQAPAKAPRGAGQPKLGDILVERGIVTAAQVAEAARLQEQTGKRMGLIMVEKKWLSEAALFQALAEQLDLPFVSLRAGLYDPVAVSLLERDVAKRLNVIPLFVVENTLTLATGEPQAVHSIDEIRARTGCRIRVAMAPPADINRVRDDAYGGTMPDFIHSEANDLELVDSQIPDDYTQIDQMAGASPVINMVNAVIQR